MPRIARIVAIGYPHHITQRGNYRQTVFTDNSEYSQYLTWLNEYADKNKLLMLAYCLMPNHVHFVAIPKKEDSLAKTFNTCHMRYSQYFNKRNKIRGHLWQGRFYSCILDERHLYATIRYIESNPVRAKLVKKAENWQWSSTKAHLSKNKGKSIFTLADVANYIEVDDWREYLSQKEDESIIAKIRSNTLSGKPLGNEIFISKLEKICGSSLKTLPRGRPKKKKKK